MKILNPLYARQFSWDLKTALESRGVQQVKLSHCLHAHRMLEAAGYAFPGDNDYKLQRAESLVYRSLIDSGVRVGRQKAARSSIAVLYCRRPIVDKPMYVDRSDSTNYSVLQGEGHDYNYWCETQWVPWMVKAANDLIAEIKLHISLCRNHPSSDSRLESIDHVQDFFNDFVRQLDWVKSREVGRQKLAENQALLAQVRSSLIKFTKFFGLQDQASNWDFSEHEDIDLDNLVFVKQDLPAMKKASDEEIFSVLENSSVKIALQLEDPDSSFEVRPK